MPYILNTNIKNDKKVVFGLQKIFGLGEKTCKQIIHNLGLSNSVKIKNCTNLQLEKIIQSINHNVIFGVESKQLKKKNIQRLISIASFRGFRHRQGLPTRGQRTHGNAKTQRKFKINE